MTQLDAKPIDNGAISSPERPSTLLIAHPSADVYGADLQMLQTVQAMRDRGWRVVVAIPDDGPLVSRLTALGAEVCFLPFPVLRRASATPSGLVRLGASASRAVPRLRRLLRRIAPDVTYVNTVTIPWWLIASRSQRIPCVCHVHEAEAQDRRLVRLALNSPLLAADSLIAISDAAADTVGRDLPALKRRTQLIYNGVPEPDTTIAPLQIDGPLRLLVAGRLSPRKAPHIALEATAALRRAGRDVHLEVCGTPFAGYEWYEQELRDRSGEPDLEGAVTFSGYTSPLWPAIARSHFVLAPSLREPFGNVVVEAQLAGRPVIAAAAMGHLATVLHEQTGLLTSPGDAPAMASAVVRLLEAPAFARTLAEQGSVRAARNFSVARYGSEIAHLIAEVADMAPSRETNRRTHRA